MTEQRLTALEVGFSHMADTLTSIESDVREMRDTMIGAKGAGRALLGVIGLLGAVVGWIGKGWAST
jgi:hypothetical protein